MLVSVSGAVRLKNGRETVENEPYELRPRTSVTGEKSDRADALIREKMEDKHNPGFYTWLTVHHFLIRFISLPT